MHPPADNIKGQEAACDCNMKTLASRPHTAPVEPDQTSPSVMQATAMKERDHSLLSSPGSKTKGCHVKEISTPIPSSLFPGHASIKDFPNTAQPLGYLVSTGKTTFKETNIDVYTSSNKGSIKESKELSTPASSSINFGSPLLHQMGLLKGAPGNYPSTHSISAMAKVAATSQSASSQHSSTHALRCRRPLANTGCMPSGS